jgi:curli production assembly/transport component CsgG
MSTKRFITGALLASVSLALAGCSPNMAGIASGPPVIAPVTPVQRDLIYLPPPPQPVPIAVYSFTDQTGQLKASENIQSLSRAVTQGGTSVLVKALRDAGNGNWFTVVERERLDNLLKERQIIREMRQRYLGEAETPANVLPSLLFAGILLEGGIVGYDTNTQTGGLGARFLGIGANVQYRQNTVTVYLRAISVKTGEVLGNVVTSKTIASVQMQADVFKFIEFDKLAEGEIGMSSNEPVQIATQAAIEKAVYSLIMEGAVAGPRQLWSFADQAAGQQYMDTYRQEKDRAIAAGFRPSAMSTPQTKRARRDKSSRTPPAPTAQRAPAPLAPAAPQQAAAILPAAQPAPKRVAMATIPNSAGAASPARPTNSLPGAEASTTNANRSDADAPGRQATSGNRVPMTQVAAQ